MFTGKNVAKAYNLALRKACLMQAFFDLLFKRLIVRNSPPIISDLGGDVSDFRPNQGVLVFRYIV